MSKMQLLQDYLNERLTAVAVEIFGAVENTIADYQAEISRSNEEIECLRRLLDLVFQPDIKLQKADPPQLTLLVPEEEVLAEKQHCEQEWSPSLGQEDPEPTLIKEEQELRTSQEEDQRHGLDSDTKGESTLTPPFVKSNCDQDPAQPSHLPHTQTVDIREGDSLARTISSKQIKIENEEGYSTSEPTSDLQTIFNVNSDCLAASSENGAQPNMNNRIQREGLSGYKAPQGTSSAYERESIGLHIDVRGQNTSKLPPQRSPYQPQGIQRVYRCRECGKCFSFSCQLEVHMRWHTKERPFSCSVCRKGFTTISMLRRHHRIHTGEKPFRCHICGKCFNQSAHLNTHFKIHPGERPHGWKMARSKR